MMFSRIAGVMAMAALTVTLSAQTKSGTAKQSSAAKTAAAKTTAKKSTNLPEGLPDGATPVGNAYWRWVDKKGVAWIYHQTPFGMVRDQETPEDRAEMAATNRTRRDTPTPGDVTVVDRGETLEFSRETPFGKSSWTSKKAELTDEEAAIWAKAQAGHK